MRPIHSKLAIVLWTLLCSLLLVGAAIASQQLAPSVDDWEYNSVTDHYYLYVDYGMEWLDAEAYAVLCGGHLVTINNAEEQDWLISQFGVDYWIGFNDIAEEGTWVWSSGQSATYTNWFAGEPNNSDGTEDAASLENWGEPGWNDLDPDAASPFVVEAPTPVEPPFPGNPQFRVDPQDNEIWGHEFPPGANILVTIEDPVTPLSPDFVGDTQANEWGDFSLQEFTFDVAAGQFVTVTDGETIKTHTVTKLWLDGVDPDSDTVWGTAEKGSNLWVWTDDGEVGRLLTADAVDGTWIFDVAGEYDIVLGTRGGASQGDEDEDHTIIDWNVPNAHFAVRQDDDTVSGWEWAPDDAVHIAIDDLDADALPDHELDAPTNQWGEFETGDVGYDIMAGYTVTVTQGEAIKTHVVTELVVTEVDPGLDTVSGTAEPGSEVEVYAWTDEEDRAAPRRFATADAGTGVWTVDFTEPDDDPRNNDDENRGWEIGFGSNGIAAQQDFDDDRTEDHWNVPNSHFAVRQDEDAVSGWEWAPDDEVHIAIDDLDADALPDHELDAPTNQWGEFETGDVGYDIMAGYTVTVTQGEAIKTHVVTELVVTEVDPGLDTVSGTAEPGSEVEVYVWSDEEDRAVPRRFVTADPGSGFWLVDFTEPDDDPRNNDDENRGWEIDLGSNGMAAQQDFDDDKTEDHWNVPNPVVRVDALGNGFFGHEWPVGATLTVTVGDPSAADFEGTAEVNEWGDFDLDAGGFDVVAGDLVTVTDGVTTKSHMVTELVVTGVDAESDTVSGTAAGNSVVEVFVHEWQNDSIWVTADGSTGEWTADFSSIGDILPGTDGAAMQSDDEDDSTWAWWSVARPLDWQYNATTGHRYLWVQDDDVASFAHAEAYAAALGGHLVTINDEAEMDWLVGTMGAGYRIGLNDIAVEGEWVWASGEPLGYTAWLPGEPNDSWRGEDVGEIWNAPPVGWNDVPDRGGPFVVEVADSKPPAETPVETGTDVEVPVTVATDAGPVEITVVFDEVDSPGMLTVAPLPSAPAAVPAGFKIVGDGRFDVVFTGTFVGEIEIAFPYDPSIPNARALRLKVQHWKNNGWVDVTDRVDTSAKLVWARVGALSPFVLTEPTNTAPTAVADTGYTTAEDAPLSVATPGVLGNDQDVDGDLLTAIKVAGPSHGTLALNANGSFTYSPHANWHGTDTFTYKANDGTADSNTATVSIVVRPVNDAPTAAADTGYTTAEDAPLSVAAPGVLANDTDIDGGPLTAVKVTDPAHGTLALNADGSFTYTPHAGWSGTDTFTYKAYDGAAYSPPVGVTISVNPVDDSVATVVALTAKPTALAKYGAATTISVTLRNASTGALIGGQTVYVQHLNPATKQWVDAQALNTSATGVATWSTVPRSTTRYRLRYAGAADTWKSSESSIVKVVPKASVGTPTAKRVKARTYTLRSTLKPQHKVGTYPVRIYKWKRVGGKWKSYGYIKAKASDYSSYSRCSVKYKFPSTGKWRLRAIAPADAGHAKSYSRYLYFTVK